MLLLLSLIPVLVQIFYVLFLRMIRLNFDQQDFQEFIFREEIEVDLPGISVVIPIRNELSNLPDLLESLDTLDYPNYEILLVDDHSDDGSSSLLLSKQNSIKYLKLPSKLHGKKAALTYGISKARYEVIACTDGDCIVPSQWLMSIGYSYNRYNWSFCAMPVFVKGGWDLWSVFQMLEYAGMAYVIQFGIVKKWYYLANGANMAFSKNAFDSIQGFDNNIDIPSGDDVFLINTLANNDMKVLYQPGPAVFTTPVKSLKTFVLQRLRWGGKNSLNPSKIFQYILIGVGISNLLILLSLFFLVWFKWPMSVLIWASIGVKFFGDFLFLFYCLRRFHLDISKLVFFPFVWSMNILYISLIGPLSLLIRTINWKGRKIVARRLTNLKD